jgi:hypothetical protein
MARGRQAALGLCGLVAAACVAHRSPSRPARGRLPELTTFPSQHEALPTNGRIVFHLDLSRVELRAGDDRIPLRSGGMLPGGHFVRVPAKELEPRTRYVLSEAEGGTPYEELFFEHEVPEWTTGPGPDHVAPRWSAAPTAVSGGSWILAPISDNESVMFIAEVRPIDRRESKADPSRAVLFPRGGQVYVDYWTTGRAFNLEPGQRYAVKLTAIDAAGNEARAPGPPVEIVGPAQPAQLPRKVR